MYQFYDENILGLFIIINSDVMTTSGGMVAGDSAISTVGLGVGLNYRGFNIQDLSKNCIFE